MNTKLLVGLTVANIVVGILTFCGVFAGLKTPPHDCECRLIKGSLDEWIDAQRMEREAKSRAADELKRRWKAESDARKKKKLEMDREWLARYEARKKAWEEQNGKPWVDGAHPFDAKAKRIRKEIEAAEKQTMNKGE